MSDERKFKPKLGQTDYTNARWAPVVSCVVRHGGRILVVKRSAGMRFYAGLWNGIGGFLDDQKSLEEKVGEELLEEAGIGTDDIESIKLGEIFDADDPAAGKTWIVHAVLIVVKTDKVVLDWEAEEYKWIEPKEVLGLGVAAGFERVVRNFFDLE